MVQICLCNLGKTVQFMIPYKVASTVSDSCNNVDKLMGKKSAPKASPK